MAFCLGKTSLSSCKINKKKKLLNIVKVYSISKILWEKCFFEGRKSLDVVILPTSWRFKGRVV